MEIDALMRIHHVSLPRPAGSDEVIRQFYGDLLRLEELPPPKGAGYLSVIVYQIGVANELHLFVEEAAPLSQRHFCIEVEDLSDWRRLLELAGVAIIEDFPIPGRPRFFVRDPVGNLVEFMRIEADYRLLQ